MAATGQSSSLQRLQGEFPHDWGLCRSSRSLCGGLTRWTRRPGRHFEEPPGVLEPLKRGGWAFFPPSQRPRCQRTSTTPRQFACSLRASGSREPSWILPERSLAALFLRRSASKGFALQSRTPLSTSEACAQHSRMYTRQAEGADFLFPSDPWLSRALPKFFSRRTF